MSACVKLRSWTWLTVAAADAAGVAGQVGDSVAPSFPMLTPSTEYATVVAPRREFTLSRPQQYGELVRTNFGDNLEM